MNTKGLPAGTHEDPLTWTDLCEIRRGYRATMQAPRRVPMPLGALAWERAYARALAITTNRDYSAKRGTEGHSKTPVRNPHREKCCIAGPVAQVMKGVLGEIATARWLGIPEPSIEILEGPDGGVDLIYRGVVLQVKTRTKPPSVVPEKELQRQLDRGVAINVFCDLPDDDDGSVILLGWNDSTIDSPRQRVTTPTGPHLNVWFPEELMRPIATLRAIGGA